MRTHPNNLLTDKIVIDRAKDSDTLEVVSAGLTKREYFAALAMQGILSAPKYWLNNHNSADELALRHADALIAALNEGE